MILKIRQSDDMVLREPTEKVEQFDHELQFLIDNMIETMRKNNGVGLAAPQVGVLKKIFVCEFEGDKESNLAPFPLTVMCNPEIVELNGQTVNMVEGCLSFPGLELLVRRPEKIKIKAQDRHGKPIEIEASGLYARVMQHETDHLNCTLLIDHMQETRVLFIGQGTLGVKALQYLAADAQYKIVGVVTGETKKIVSRKGSQAENPILAKAKKLKLPIIETTNINDPKIIEKIKELKPELGIMADFGQIIKEEILNIPEYGIINIHPSLLPRHRGPSPIQETILAGDDMAGVSLILTSKKMDAGGIISQTAVELSSAETSSILKEYLSDVGAILLLNTIPYYIAGDLKPIPQKEERATYTHLFKKEDGFVESKTPAVEVERKIRAFDVWPKVYTIIDNTRIQLLSTHLSESGQLVIDQVKPEGKNDMSYEDFVRGYRKHIEFRD